MLATAGKGCSVAASQRRAGFSFDHSSELQRSPPSFQPLASGLEAKQLRYRKKVSDVCLCECCRGIMTSNKSEIPSYSCLRGSFKSRAPLSCAGISILSLSLHSRCFFQDF